MDAILVRLLQTVARPIALALVHSLWQGAIVAGVVAVALTLLRRRTATVRYAVACLGLLAILTTTVATGIWFAGHPEAPASEEIVWRRAALPAGAGSDTAPGEESAAAASDVRADTRPGAPPAASGDQSTSRSGLPSLPTLDMSLAGPWVFTGWVAGVFLLAGMHLRGWKRAKALAWIGTAAVPREWRDRLDRLSSLVGLARSVRALVSSRVSVPTVIGWIRPVILIPAAVFTELSASDLELILIHELAHIRRHDILVNYAQAAAETLLFYHPVVWWISRQIRVEREHCCDDATVCVCGDGVTYARALLEVEHMRDRTPVHAMAADGGSFRNRIRRLAGAAPSGPSPHRAGLSAVLVITLVVGLLVPSLSASPVTGVSANAVASVPSAWKDVEGEWRAEGFGGSVRLHFESPGWGEITLTFDGEKFDSSGGNLLLERDAGTFILEGGRMPRRWRKAIFRPNAEFAAGIEELGYEIEDERKLLELAIHDVTLDFARGIAAAGYDISVSRLVEFHIHDVTPEYVQAMADAGYDQLTPSKIVEFAIHDIEPDYVARMAAIGYEDLTPSRLVEFAVHDISAEYVERLVASGYDKFTPSRIVEFAIHGVQPEFVRELVELGYGDLDPGKLVEFRIHDVTPEFIRDLRDHGLTDVSPSKLVEYRITGVPWEDLRKGTTRL
jgi:hypothetical protein